MTLKNTLLRSLLFTSLIFLLSQSSSNAQGGFPVRPGRLLLSPSVTYFYANTQWDSTGVKKPFPKNGEYSSISATLFGEYGFSRRLAAVVTVPFVYNDYKDNSSQFTSSGITDVETGLKVYVANINFIYYISLQATAITPFYTNHTLGYDEEGGELKLAFSGTGHLGSLSTYFNLDDAVRQYFGTNGPIQNRYNGTFGLTLDKDFKNQVSVSAGGIYSVSDDKAFSPILETNKDFSFLQASLSYGHSFTREISIFVTGGKFITGRNTSDGTSATLAFIYRLDYR